MDEAACPYCFHQRHDEEIGSWNFDPGGPIVQRGPTSCIVLWCRDESCVCGIPPCPQCGARSRRVVENRFADQCVNFVERCACGAEWDHPLFA